MNTLSFEMMSADHNDWFRGLNEIIQATENVKDLIVCHFIKLNELLKRINIYKKQSNYEWVQSQQKVAMKSEFYSYLRMNTRILDNEFNALNKDFLLYKDSIDKFKVNILDQDIPIASEFKEITLEKLLNGEIEALTKVKLNPSVIEIHNLEAKSTKMSIDMLDNTYLYNYQLFTSVKSSQDGIFSQADTIIKDMRKQF